MKVELERDIWHESIYVLLFNKSLLHYNKVPSSLLGDKSILNKIWFLLLWSLKNNGEHKNSVVLTKYRIITLKRE